MTFLSGIESDYLIVKALTAAIAQVTESFGSAMWDKAVQDFDTHRYQIIKDVWASTLDPTGHFRQWKRPSRPGKPSKRKN